MNTLLEDELGQYGIVKQFEQTSYYLKDIDLINNTVGWAVGAPHWDQVSKTYTATIIKTTNGGKTWTAQNANDVDPLNSVDFINGRRGWAVGANGTILRTTDGGNSWNQQTVATTDEFTDVVFVDANQGWATTTNPIHYDWAGYPDNWEASIWHTSNGGRTWVEQTIPNNASILKDVDFVDSQKGWAVGVKYVRDDQWGDPLHQPIVYYTNDGGLTWQEQYSPKLGITFSAVDFINSTEGWVAGFPTSALDGAIFHTTDGGQTWKRQEGGGLLRDVEFIDSNRGYTVGGKYGFDVWQTTNGGQKWNSLWIDGGPLLEGSSNLYGLAVSDNRVVAVGDHNFITISENPWITDNPATTLDELGNTFTTSYINTHYQFEDVYFADEQNGWAVGWRSYKPGYLGQVIFHTSDGGQTWQTQYEDAPDLSSLFDIHRLDSVYFTDAQNGWAVGTSIGKHGAILHTSDGGQTWVEQGQFEAEFFAVEFLDAQNGWALATGSWLAHTTDGGNHWNLVDTGIFDFLDIGFATVQGDVTFTDANHGWAVGGLGTIIHTEDGGQTWTRQRLPDPDNSYPPPDHPPWRLHAVDFINNQEGWIAGEGVWHTTDGGLNWVAEKFQSSPYGGGDFKDIEFVDKYNGWLANESGAILITHDGGYSWNLFENNVSSAGFLGISFVSPEKGWLVGYEGTIVQAVNPVNTSKGTNQNNSLTGTVYDDIINGLGGKDTLSGDAGNDNLIGGTGNDKMIGGTGNDSYSVDSNGDTVIENPNEGTDIIRSTVSYTLSANVENLILTGTASINGTGNELNNVITGNNGDNILNGGAGGNILIGGNGNDTYIVADLHDDVVREDYAGGIDTVQFSPFPGSIAWTWDLDSNVENLIITGTGNLDGEGNDLNNVITGNSSKNQLEGGYGNDTLYGGAGNDSLYGSYWLESYGRKDKSNDQLFGGEGNDLLRGNAGNDRLNGDAGNDRLFGDAGNDILRGGAGNDRLNGGKGGNTVFGGGGADIFILTQGDGQDTIKDFKDNVDKIQLPGQLSFGDLSLGTNNGNTNLSLGDDLLAILVGISDSNLITEVDFI